MLNGWTTLTIEWALALLTLTFLALRIYLRFTIPSNSYTLSDGFVICAWIGFAVFLALDAVLYTLGVLEPGSYYSEDLTHKHASPEKNIKLMKVRRLDLEGPLCKY